MAGLWKCLKAAFSARPLGMPVPPNWLFLAGVGLATWALGPEALLIGLGLELGYLFWLATSRRFQKTVLGEELLHRQRQAQQTQADLLERLDARSRLRYESLADRCRGILDQQTGSADSAALEALGTGLSRLLWVFQRLLATRTPIEGLVKGDQRSSDLDRRAQELEERVAEKDLGEDLRKSLLAQLDIVRQRQGKRKEAEEKLAFLDAELTRIGEQVELLREQALLAQDPRAMSERVDAIAGSLGGTSDWIAQQQRLAGQLEDVVGEAPPLAIGSLPTRAAARAKP